MSKMQKLKGCRPSADVAQDYSNVSAQLGDTIFQIDRGHASKQLLLKRQRELMLEMNASQAQEKANAEKAAAGPKEAANVAPVPSQEAKEAANG